jgi:hypothetical protein
LRVSTKNIDDAERIRRVIDQAAGRRLLLPITHRVVDALTINQLPRATPTAPTPNRAAASWRYSRGLWLSIWDMRISTPASSASPPAAEIRLPPMILPVLPKGVQVMGPPSAACRSV